MAALAHLRAEEFKRLGEEVYVDHAGATLPSEKQLEHVFKDMTSHAYGNPHTDAGGGGPAGSDVLIERARNETLAMCNVSPADYDCVFTSGATGALKLVAEAFPWSPDSVFAYTLDNHNSVVGMREEALAAGAAAQAVVPTCDAEGSWHLHPSGERMRRQSSDASSQRSRSRSRSRATSDASSSGSGALSSTSSGRGSIGNSSGGIGNGHNGGSSDTPPSNSLPDGLPDGPGASYPAAPTAAAQTLHLFAFPAESNFSGARYDLNLATAIARGDSCAAALEAEQPGDADDSQRSPASQRRPSSSSSGAEPAGGDARGRWLVVLDAAKACGSHPPDLDAHPVDFVALSYYKIFGYPTGLGALLVRRDAVQVLRKRFFGGGTVEVSVSNADFFRRREGAAGLEDGTAHFLGIAALRHGYAVIRRAGGFPAVDAWASLLARHTVQQLLSLQHFNGRPVAEVYTGAGVAAAALSPPPAGASVSPADRFASVAHAQTGGGSNGDSRRTSASSTVGTFSLGSTLATTSLSSLAASSAGNLVSGGGGGGNGGGRERHSSDGAGSEQAAGYGIADQGPTVAFNLRRADGSWVGYREVERLAGLRRIRLRTGAFCNPGATAAALGLSPEEVRSHYEDAGHVCWDARDLIDGRPTGAVRVSYGYMSDMGDAEAVLSLVRDFFVEGGGFPAADKAESPAAATLQQNPAAAAAASPVKRLDDSPSADDQSPQQRPQQQQPPVPLPLPMPPALPQLPHASAQQPVPPPVLPPQPPGTPPELTPRPCIRPEASSSLELCSPCSPAASSSTGTAIAPAALPQPALVGSAASPATGQSSDREGRLTGLWVYPIKSAAPIAAQSWPLGPNGLALDREWALVNPNGGALRRGRHPRLATIQPRIDLEAGYMEVTSPHMAAPLRISLAAPGGAGDAGQQEAKQQPTVSVRVCGDLVPGCAAVLANPASQQPSSPVADAAGGASPAGASAPRSSADAVSAWFSEAVGTRCSLVRQQAGARSAFHARSRHSQDSAPDAARASIGFANEGQLLLVNAASLTELRRRLPPVGAGPVVVQHAAAAAESAAQPAAASPADVARFRPNLLVDGPPAFAEDAWQSVRIGGTAFNVTGPCARCEVVCGDPITGERSGPEPLLTLASFRRERASINFGVLLGADGGAARGNAADGLSGAGAPGAEGRGTGGTLGGGGGGEVVSVRMPVLVQSGPAPPS